MTGSGDALDRVLQALDGVGCTYQHSDGNIYAHCPAHDDHKSSLSIRDNGNGKVLVKCHAGCDTEEIVDALGLTMADLFDGPPEANGRNGQADQSRRIAAIYPYTDEDGTLLYEKIRYDPKGFSIRRPDGRGGWIWKLGDMRRVLYRLTEVRAAVRKGRTVYVCEGEKDADRAAAIGVVATCNLKAPRSVDSGLNGAPSMVMCCAAWP